MDAATRPPDLSQKLPPLSKLLGSRAPKSQAPPTEPPPPTPALPAPPLTSSVRFEHPSRRILSDHDHELFLASPTYTLVTAFIFGLSDAVRSQPSSAILKQPQHPTITAVVGLLDAAEALVKQHPAQDLGGSRFGNPAFRELFDAVEAALPRLHRELFAQVRDATTTSSGEREDNSNDENPEERRAAGAAAAGLIDQDAAIDELATYVLHSLGSRQRLDYGSGHELNFALWLLGLNRLGLLPPSAFGHATVVAFPRYLRLARAVQTAYYLEPAGSHGVWGLDDFQFLPFLWGAAQLVRHPFLRPKSIHHAAVLDECQSDFLYLEQVVWVNSTKNVEGLRWHSPMLDDISAAKSWEKVEGGMRKMFVKEVLGKKAVMQHFLFGGLIPAVEGMSADEGDGLVDEGHAGHDHGGGVNSWGDCCGIKVPSAIGAQQEMMKRGAQDGLRRIPFD